MLKRCLLVTHTAYANYGGRGITVCDRWRGPTGFVSFLADMGERPEDTDLDRIDVNGNYEPSNCRWATQRQQVRNRRDNHFIEFQGERKTIAEWAEIVGLTNAAIEQRIKRGWSVERTMTAPLRVTAPRIRRAG